MIPQLRVLRNNRGQAMVEMALLLPMLMMLVFGILEFGRAWNAHQALTDAAREGTRRMVVMSGAGVTDATVKQTVKEALGRVKLDTTATTVITLTGLNGGVGTEASVAISYPYTFPVLGKLLKWTTGRSNVTIRTTSVMRNEG
jgi:Flp pilus assembly protein TadG